MEIQGVQINTISNPSMSVCLCVCTGERVSVCVHVSEHEYECVHCVMCVDVGVDACPPLCVCFLCVSVCVSVCVYVWVCVTHTR